jgi:hypothetical protein
MSAKLNVIYGLEFLYYVRFYLGIYRNYQIFIGSLGINITKLLPFL